jgi:integrase
MIRIPTPTRRGRQFSLRFSRFGRELRLTAPTAEEAERLWLAEYLKGETEAPDPAAAGETVRRMFGAYADEIYPLNGERDERDWKERHRLDLILSTCTFTDCPAVTVERSDVRAWYKDRLMSVRRRGRGRIRASTANKELERFGTIFSWAIESEWGGFTENSPNPAHGIKKVIHDGKRDRVFHGDERERLFAALKGRPIEPITLWGYYSGMRLSEILRMRRCDFQGTDAIAAFSHKGSTPRRRLMPDAIAWIEGYIAQEEQSRCKRFLQIDPLFRWDATSSAASHAFRMAARDAGLHDFHFHDLRHVRATMAAEMYGDVWMLMSVTGHRDVALANDYVHKATLAKKFDEQHK